MTVASGAAAGLGQLPVREFGLAAGGDVLARLLVRRLRHPGRTTTTSPAPGGTRAGPTPSSANPPANFGGGSASSLAFSLYASLAAAADPAERAHRAHRTHFERPENTGLPAISGTTTAGQPLSATNGHLDGSPTSYAYQWQRCDNAGANCTPISGATSNSTRSSPPTSTRRSGSPSPPPTRTGSSTPATSDQTAVVAAAPAAPPSRQHGAAGDQRDDDRRARR